MHDSTSVNTLAAAISGESVLDGSDNLIAITSRLHWEVTDSDGNTIRIGMGGSTQGKKSTVEGHMSGNVYRHQAQNGAGQTWYSAYQEDTTGTNYLVHVTTTGGGDDYAEYRLPVAFYGAFKAAYEDGNINIDAYELAKEASGDGLRQSSLGSNQYGSGADTYTRGVLLQYKTAGFKGNACRIVLKDPNGVLDSDAKQRGISYGYEEYTSATMRAAYGNRDDNLGTNNNFPGESLNTEIYFRGGTIAGSGSDTALTTANIAEAIKEIVNGSKLGITATRSDSTVSLENDTDGDSGNVTITTTNAGALFTVAGMDNTEASSEGGDSVARRTTVSADQLNLKSAGGLSASTDNKAGLRIAVDQLAATASIMGSSFIPMEESGGSVSKKISVTNLLGSLVAGSDTQVQFNQHGTTFAASSNLTFDGSGSLTAGTGMNTGIFSGSGVSTVHRVTLDRATIAEADINGGAIDNATIGASTPAAAEFTTISGSSTLDVAGQSRFGTENQTTISAVGLLSSSATATIANATLDQVTVGSADINGGAIDGTTIGASSQTSGKFTTISGSGQMDIAGQARFGTENQTTISSVGLLSSSATATLANATLDQVTVGSADINGGAIDGATIGASSQSSVKATTLSGSSTLNVEGISSFGPGALTTISAAGVVSGSGTSTLHQLTADRVTVNTLDVNTINSNTVTQNTLEVSDFLVVAGVSGSSSNLSDGGFQIGGGDGGDGLAAIRWNDSDAGLRITSGSTAVLKINSSGLEVASGVISGSGVATLHRLTIDRATLAEVDINGGAIDAAVIGASSQAAGSFTTVSGSGDSTIHKVTMNQLVAATADINGGTLDGAVINNTTIGASTPAAAEFTTISGSSTLDIAGQSRFGTENQTTISAVGLLSSSATATLANATLDQVTIGSADINGGAIDGATIGASSQTSGKFTTISGSGQMDIAGQARFGTENQTTISAVGLLSSSATATLANATLDQVTVGSADINGGAIDGATIGASSQSSVKATTLSGSSTLNVEGISSFGPGALTTISVAGVVSGSGTSTLHQVTADRVTVAAASLTAITFGGTAIAATAVELNTIADVSAGGDHAAAIDVSADHFLFRDGGNTGAHKVESFADLATAQAGDGLQASAGAFSIVAVEDHFVSSSANEGSTFLLSQTASSNAAISVYVNGIFQAQSGSNSVHGSGNGDYSISGSTLNGHFIVLVDANKVDEDDEVVIKYIKA